MRLGAACLMVALWGGWISAAYHAKNETQANTVCLRVIGAEK